MDYEKDKTLSIKLQGGIIDLQFFIYENVEKTLRAYHRYVNNWSLPPFFSLGFQISKWGWKNSKEWEDVWKKANENNIPLDIMWSDIDYLQDYQDFTVSSKYDVDVMKNVADLSKPEGVHWVPIIDAGIGIKSDAAQEGVQKDLFIKSS